MATRLWLQPAELEDLGYVVNVLFDGFRNADDSGEHRFRSSFLLPKGRVCSSLASCAVSGTDFPGTAGCTGVAVKDCSQTSGLDVFLPWVLSGILGSWIFPVQRR